MSLTLTISSYQRLSPGQESVKVIDRCNATIGRAADNDWVLPDPERILSSKHCTIQYQNDTYFLTDTSTNGVFLNLSEQRLERGQTVQLNDGDELKLGEYEFQVSISQPVEASSEDAEEGTDLLEISPDAMNPPIQGMFDDPFSGTPEPHSSAPLIPEDEDLLGGLDIPDPLFADSHELDHIPPEEEFFQPLDAIPDSPASGELIPENWDAPWNKPSVDLDKPPEPLPDSLLEPTPPLGPIPSLEPAPPPKPTPPPSQPASPVPVPAPVTLPPDRGNMPATEQAVLQAFLSGAGLSQSSLNDADISELMTLVGAMFRQTVQGLMGTLRARYQVKSEFRLSQTTIQPAANNPLKFSLSVEDAIAALLFKRGAAYMPPVQAIEQGFADIEAHQLAVMAGMQAALDKLLERFDPKNLETRLGQHSVLDNILPANRKAKYWDLFTALYSEIVREAEDDFQELFGREFARAYEEQIRKL